MLTIVAIFNSKNAAVYPGNAFFLSKFFKTIENPFYCQTCRRCKGTHGKSFLGNKEIQELYLDVLTWQSQKKGNTLPFRNQIISL
jgi:predicted nucleic-acid-binding Zn-ribbon protein